jgi:hypothetical protein
LQQVAKVTGRTPPDLVTPVFPDRLAHVWQAFVELHSGRSYSGSGPNPLSWSDIKAWDDLMGLGLKEWEIRAIKALDSVWLRVMSEDTGDDGL